MKKSESVPVVPTCSSDRGNSISPIATQKKEKKLINPAKRWCFTYNNYDNSKINLLVPLFQKFVKFSIVGKEVGESGTPHLQGYIEFKTKQRPLTPFKDYPSMHWTKCKGSRSENEEYCTKDSLLVDTLSIGYKAKRILKFNWLDKLKKWQIQILEILLEEPDDRTIYWFWSQEGNIGKTQFCKYLSATKGAICLHGKGADVRNGIMEYYKTNDRAPEIVLFPIPRSYNSEYLSYESLENIKDMYFYSGKYEGGMINGCPPHLIIFSNEEPDESKCSADRWKVFNIDE